MERQFSDDWVTRWHDKWTKLTAEFAGRPVRFLEIGSHEGRSACWWLDNVLTHPGASLVCVDPWTVLPQREALFDRNTADRADQVTKIKATSAVALPGMARRSIDLAYIDGSHEAADVMLDALLVLPLMKIGGVMLFDDYEWVDTHRHVMPKVAIDALEAMSGWRLGLIEKYWQAAYRVKA